MNKKTAHSIGDLQNGMIRILISLTEHTQENPANITILKKKTGLHNETIEAKIELLKAMQLIEDKKERIVPCTHKIWLTERGHKLSEILQSGDAYLKNP